MLSTNRREDRALKTAAGLMLTLSLLVVLKSCAHAIGFDISTWSYAQVRASMEDCP